MVAKITAGENEDAVDDDGKESASRALGWKRG
jgi:hypothetical protein